MSFRRDWILVTGHPGCGKTTAVRRLCQALQQHQATVQGFVTREVLCQDNNDSGSTSNARTRRSGFDIVTVPDGRRARLARKRNLPSSWPRTGAYRVDVASIDAVAVPSITLPPPPPSSRFRYNNDNNDDVVIVLDEIGRLELHSTEFQNAVQNLLDRPQDGLRLVGAITAPRNGHRVAFCDHVTAHEGVQVHNLTRKTRDDTTRNLLDYIQNHWIDRDQKIDDEGQAKR